MPIVKSQKTIQANNFLFLEDLFAFPCFRGGVVSLNGYPFISPLILS